MSSPQVAEKQMPSPVDQSPSDENNERARAGIRSLIYTLPDPLCAEGMQTSGEGGAADKQTSQAEDTSPNRSPRGILGLPGLWRRVAPDVSTATHEQRPDLSASYTPTRDQQDPYAVLPGYFERLQSQRSLREQYALPGQVPKGRSMSCLIAVTVYKHSASCEPAGR